jgi:acetyltransferase-like isoleucine patch superfamily enzyme
MKFNNINVFVSPLAKIGKNVRIGDNSIIYDNVEIGDNTIISNNCVIGEPHSEYYDNKNFINPTTSIGSNSLIRSHCIIYSGSEIGNCFSTGHRVTIRENCKIGENCRIGTLCDLQGNLTIKEYVWLHSNVHVGQSTIIQRFVFVYPYVIFTNDPRPPSNQTFGPEIGEFTQIAVNSVVLPGVKIGTNCLIGANSLVSKTCGDYKMVIGSPGKVVKDVRDIIDENGDKLYPWPYRFERGMPWEGIGFDKWKEENDNLS